MMIRNLIQKFLIKIPYIKKWVVKNKVEPDKKLLLEKIKKGLGVMVRAQEGRNIRASRLKKEEKLVRRIKNMHLEPKRRHVGTIFDKNFFSDFEWNQMLKQDPDIAMKEFFFQDAGKGGYIKWEHLPKVSKGSSPLIYSSLA